jgi:hypothetical protein
MECGRVGEFKDSHFASHLYGVFTAAKERLVNAGRKNQPPVMCIRRWSLLSMSLYVYFFVRNDTYIATTYIYML